MTSLRPHEWLIVAAIALAPVPPASGQSTLPLSMTADWDVKGFGVYGRYGEAVAGVGDYNADGWGDVVVGAPGSTAFFNGGEIHMYHGSQSGLSAQNAWVVKESQLEAGFGASVAWLGDFNGDSYEDFAVGSPLFNARYTDEGRVHVYFGRPAGRAGNPWIIPGNSPLARFGASVLGAGDLNGDEIDDLVVGAPGYRVGAPDAGAVFLYSGATAQPASPIWSYVSETPGAGLGSCLAGGGDVNGDGYNDIVVGAPGYADAVDGAGAVYVFFGSSSGFGNAPAHTIIGTGAFSEFGTSVAMVDLNGDGYSDVVVGDPGRRDPNTGDVGAVHVYYSLGASGELRPGERLTEGKNRFGASVAASGDLDRDGFGDLIVGTIHVASRDLKKAAFIYRGGPGGINPVPVQVLQRYRDGFYFTLNVSAATAGDVNGDGVTDVVVGNNDYLSGGSGEAFVYHGTGAGAGDLVAAPAWRVSHAALGARRPPAVAMAGDVDGDGWDDLVIGGPDDGPGSAQVFNGRAGGWETAPSWHAQGAELGDWFGHAVAGVGDVNGDGYADVAVGAPHATGMIQDEGAVYCYLGSADGLEEAPWFTAWGGKRASLMGYAVAGAGDVNGDGYSDIVASAFRFGGGRVCVYYGNPHALSDSLRWVGDIGQDDAWFGYAVAVVGDVDRDGYSDIVVGAPYFDAGDLDEGALFVYMGGENGLTLERSQRIELDRAGAMLGVSVACAGDVNADGYADVIAGAGGDCETVSEVGAAFVYLGSGDGLATSPVWRMMGRIGTAVGRTVCGLGDVNGDGYADVAVGDPLFDLTDVDCGRVSLFHGGSAGPGRVARWQIDGSTGSERLGTRLLACGDVNGDGRFDLLTSTGGASDSSNGGEIALFETNGARALIIRPVQVPAGDAGSVALLGFTGEEDAVHMAVHARPPTGARNVWLEFQVESENRTFEDSRFARGPARALSADERAAGAVVTLDGRFAVFASDRNLRWRVRVRADTPVSAGARWFYHPASVTTGPTARNGVAPDLPPPPQPPPPEQETPVYDFGIESVYPNPFNPDVTVDFTVDANGFVVVRVYDVAGAVVRSLLAEPLSAGPHRARWNGRDERNVRVASGIYFVRVESSGRHVARKMVLVR